MTEEVIESPVVEPVENKEFSSSAEYLDSRKLELSNKLLAAVQPIYKDIIDGYDKDKLLIIDLHNYILNETAGFAASLLNAVYMNTINEDIQKFQAGQLAILAVGFNAKFSEFINMINNNQILKAQESVKSNETVTLDEPK